jgi:hypothetical protein
MSGVLGLFDEDEKRHRQRPFPVDHRWPWRLPDERTARVQSQVDFAVLIKNYASTRETTRYSPAKITNIERLPMFGNCDED